MNYRLRRNPSHHALSAIARMTPSVPQRRRQPKGASPPLTPNFDLFFQMRVYGHAPRGEGRQTPSARGSINHYPILSLTGFLQSRIIHKRGSPPAQQKRVFKMLIPDPPREHQIGVSSIFLTGRLKELLPSCIENTFQVFTSDLLF